MLYCAEFTKCFLLMRVNLFLVLLIFVIELYSGVLSQSYANTVSELTNFLDCVNNKIESMDENDEHYDQLKKAYNMAQVIQQKIKEEKEKNSKDQNEKTIDELTKKLNEETQKIQKILYEIRKNKEHIKGEILTDNSTDNSIEEKGNFGCIPSSSSKRIGERGKTRRESTELENE